MFLFIATAFAAIALSTAAVAEAPELRGTWTAADGTNMARIEPCARNAAFLCATVIADTPVTGEPSSVGQLAVSEITPSGRGRWRGRYHNGAQMLPVTLRLKGADEVAMRVCVGMICATEIYRRTGR